jgi:hypothetical protein
MKPTDYDTGNGNELAVDVIGDTIGQYGYMDGLVLEEITAEEYGMEGQASQELLDAHPFFESIIFLTNPSFRNRRHNLIREGVGYWTPDLNGAGISIINGKMRLTTVAESGVYQLVHVKPNVDLTIKSNKTTGTVTTVLNIWSSLVNGSLLAADNGTFNTGNSTQLCVSLHNYGAGYADFDSIMLVEGTSAPVSIYPVIKKKWLLRENSVMKMM